MIEDDKRQRTDGDLVLDRDDDGNIYSSIPHRVSHYNVDQLDWGHIGPGPAELALNILDHFLPPGCDGEKPVSLEKGEISAVTWRLHRAFMADHLVRLPYEGGCLHEGRIRRWILEYFSEPKRVPEEEGTDTWWHRLVGRSR
ncbi:MAG: hypothetical protein R3217_05345 [Gammaproteobacteria bacterium]|nr:hypothetical protein [Gammaproteobacteria bacterium]